MICENRSQQINRCNNFQNMAIGIKNKMERSDHIDAEIEESH